MGSRYETSVRVRWSDLDAFGHVNNARVLTLLEEARVDWLFTEGSRVGVTRLTEGMVVSAFEIRYLRPIGFGPPVDVSMGVAELKAVSVVIDYQVTIEGQLAVTALSRLVPVGLPTLRPRRWEAAERDFLSDYLQET